VIAPIIKYVLPFGREPARDALRIHPNHLAKRWLCQCKVTKNLWIRPIFKLKKCLPNNNWAAFVLEEVCLYCIKSLLHRAL